MALFESYERRIDQINAVLNRLQRTLDLMFTIRLRRFSQFVLRMLAGLTQLVQLSQLRRVAEEQQMLQQQSVKDFSLSVSQVLLLITVR